MQTKKNIRVKPVRLKLSLYGYNIPNWGLKCYAIFLVPLGKY